MKFLSKNVLAKTFIVTVTVLIATIYFSWVRDYLICELIVKNYGNKVAANIIAALLMPILLISTLLVFRKYMKIPHASLYRLCAGSVTTIVFLFLLFANKKSSAVTMTYLDWVSLFLYYFSVGVTEEVLFRGILFDFVRSYLGVILSLIYTSLVFGFLHLSNVVFGHPADINQIVSAIILGVVICTLYYFFGFVVAALSHTLINIFAITFLPTAHAVTILLVFCALSIFLVAAYDILYRKRSYKITP